MQKVLCVAEKPAIARALASALGGGNLSSRSSPNKYVKNWDLTYNFPSWGSCEVVVTAVLGHLSDIEFPAPFNQWKTDPVQLFSAPINEFIQEKQVANNIKKESKAARILFIWTDCDREGEHIGGEIAKQAKQANPRIQIFRAHFNNADASHMRQAAQRPAQLDWKQVDAVDIRRELDLRTGYSMTRFQTNIFKQRFPDLPKEKPVSYGSCQFPTLGFVVDRYMRIRQHKPEQFWYIALNIKNPDAKKDPKKPTITLNWERGRVFDHKIALVYYEQALEAGQKLATVTSVVTKPTTRYRPLPLTTVTLQKTGVAKLNMTSKRIMDVAEHLYNKGFISYPRTETDRFDKAIDLKELVSRQARNSNWGTYASSILGNTSGRGNKFKQPREGKHDDKAHPPIHPVKNAEPSALTAEEQKVFEFVARSFLAACSEDAYGDATTVKFDYGGETFTLSGDVVREYNFLDVYPYQKWTGTQLPEFKVGEKHDVTSAKLRDGKTVPPQPLTEPDLIALMEANGIGTDATMADHIQRIQDRLFVMKQNNKFFYPTNLGMALVQGYDKIGLEQSLAKPLLRRQTEIMVSQVANGEKPKQEVLGTLVAQYEKVFRHANQHKRELLDEAKTYLEST